MRNSYLITGFSLIIGFTFLFCSGHISKNEARHEQELRCLIVTECLPIPDTTGKMRNQDTLSISIYYYKNLTAYKLVYTMIKKWDAQGNIADKQDMYQYFVFENGSEKGYIYDSYYSQKKDTVSVDSMMKYVIWCEQNSASYYTSTFGRNIVTWTSSNRSKDHDMLYETYSYTRKNDSTTHGTASLIFTNKLNGIRFSMSRELDSIKGMKLISKSVVGYFQYLKNGVVVKDTATSRNFMQEIIPSPKDSMEIMQYFTRYQQEKGK